MANEFKYNDESLSNSWGIRCQKDNLWTSQYFLRQNSKMSLENYWSIDLKRGGQIYSKEYNNALRSQKNEVKQWFVVN